MIRKCVAFALAAALAASLHAQQADETWLKGEIVQKDGKKLSNVDILINKDLAQGTITYKAGAAKMTLKKGAYASAKLAAPPKEIADAKGLMAKKKYADAAAEYQAALEKYRHVGYEIDCLVGQGDALLKAGKTPDAIAVLNAVKDMKDVPADKEKLRQDALGLLQQAYIDKGDFAMADKIMGLQGASKDENIAAQALMRRGDMLRKQGQNKQAIIAFMKVGLLFAKENKARPQALYEVASMLKAQNDARWQDWAKKLQADYPDNPLAAQLK